MVILLTNSIVIMKLRHLFATDPNKCLNFNHSVIEKENCDAEMIIPANQESYHNSNMNQCYC